MSARPGSPYQRVRVTGQDQRHWTVQSALTEAAGSALDQTQSLVRLLNGRLTVGLPHIAGMATGPEGTTVAVYPELPGAPLAFDELTPRSALARALGVTLANLHDLEPGVYEEAGVPSYDAEGYRARRLAELDLGAATGHVPAGLLARWERALEDVALWHFPTVPTHGSVDEDDVYVDGDDVVALDGWHVAAVSDPAIDFATLFLGATPDAVDTVIESYAQARRERPDTQFERRVRLAAELRLMTDLREASTAGDEAMVHRCAKALQRLEAQTQDDTSLTPPPPGPRSKPGAAVVDPEDIEVVDENPTTDDEDTLDLPVAHLHDDELDAADEPPAEESLIEDDLDDEELGDDELGDEESLVTDEEHPGTDEMPERGADEARPRRDTSSEQDPTS